jgi:hypothetical protein
MDWRQASTRPPGGGGVWQSPASRNAITTGLRWSGCSAGQRLRLGASLAALLAGWPGQGTLVAGAG